MKIRESQSDHGILNEQIFDMDQIRSIHIEIEKSFQSIASKIQNNPCLKCQDVCCKEEICRESIESTFLRFILGDRTSEYDQENGWFDRSSGCRLEYGRPFVCYEYFCNMFDENSISWKLKEFSIRLRKIYSNVYLKKNILVVDDLSLIPAGRRQKILQDLEELRDDMKAYEKLMNPQPDKIIKSMF